MYARGQGVPLDYAEAVKWFRKAADRGVAKAQYNLGLMYANGAGVTQDYVLAHMWLNLAAAQGEPDAETSRETLGSMMTSDQIAKAQRLAREWEPTK